MHTTRTLKSAWLITWESIGAHARVTKSRRIVAILNYRCSPQRVRTFVEQLYAALGNSAWDKLNAADKPKDNSYPAIFMQISGVPWTGQIQCEDNPFLLARVVNNLQVIIKDGGREEITWIEKPVPSVSQS